MSEDRRRLIGAERGPAVALGKAAHCPVGGAKRLRGGRRPRAATAPGHY
ncbi:MAG: hypothetical protein IE925_15020 [Rhodobacterales bacterium]|nr:hypothetical protein [Rhodobacterales bacterium]